MKLLKPELWRSATPLLADQLSNLIRVQANRVRSHFTHGFRCSHGALSPWLTVPDAPTERGGYKAIRYANVYEIAWLPGNPMVARG
jgi:hypothetical protein